jgi:hypothetical protein
MLIAITIAAAGGLLAVRLSRRVAAAERVP